MLRWLDIIRLRVRSLVRRRQLDADLDRELHTHLDQQVDEYTSRGMPRDEAVRVAVSNAIFFESCDTSIVRY